MCESKRERIVVGVFIYMSVCVWVCERERVYILRKRESINI